MYLYYYVSKYTMSVYLWKKEMVRWVRVEWVTESIGMLKLWYVRVFMCVGEGDRDTQWQIFAIDRYWSQSLFHRSSNAKQGPHKAYNAYRDFVRKDTTALFLAAAMEHFGLTDVTGKS